MYISDNLYSRRCSYVDLPDREFFAEALRIAGEMQMSIAGSGVSKEFVKKHTPIAHISCLSKQTSGENDVDRRYIHGERARRRFLMGDVDFNPGQEKESKDLRERLISFAHAEKTPLMIYPTISYPQKPRFRFVFLTTRLMDGTQYHKTMLGLYSKVGYEATDASDFNIAMNRNLPVFDSREQVDAVFSTFEDGSLEPLDWSPLAKGVRLPKRKKPRLEEASASDHAVKMSEQLLLKGAVRLAGSPVCQSYDAGFWRVVASLAAAVVCGGISEKTALAVLDVLAQRATDDVSEQRRWRVGNANLLRQHEQRLSLDSDALSKTKPLSKWKEFVLAVDVD